MLNKVHKSIYHQKGNFTRKTTVMLIFHQKSLISRKSHTQKKQKTAKSGNLENEKMLHPKAIFRILYFFVACFERKMHLKVVIFGKKKCIVPL